MIQRLAKTHVLAVWDIRAIRDEHDLRDRLAGQALNGLLAYPDGGDPGNSIERHISHIADMAYRYADGMLARRMEKRP